MPTYEYRCKDCGEPLEVVQAFTDDALTECPSCGGTLKKVFGNVGIAFKGSGFYKTDSRGSKSPAAAGTNGSGSGAKGDSAPAGDSTSSSSSGGDAKSGSDGGSSSSSSSGSGDSGATSSKPSDRKSPAGTGS